MIKSVFFLRCCAALGGLLIASTAPAAQADGPRPPAVPLVACDPYFSIWSPADKLTEKGTVHWTGKPHRLTSFVSIDGKAYRLMGDAPSATPALLQESVNVLPTRTICTFVDQGIRLKMTFMTAALPEDLMVYSRPVTYLTWEAVATDRRQHDLAIYFDASAEIAVNLPADKVICHRDESVVKIGAADQQVLAKTGDDLRIDWGYLYLSPIGRGARTFTGERSELQSAFLEGRLGSSTKQLAETPVAANEVSGALLLPFPGKVGANAASRSLIIAYDDEYAIQYFRQNLRPYWRRNGDDAAALLKHATAEFESLVNRCAAFDAELMADLTRSGGEKYARLCALLYRQAIAGTKLAADANGQPLLFPKENTSNGCIGTVDIIYPMSPLFLLFGPSLTKAMLVPALDYSSSPRWRFPFAPHDLGTYPKANAQAYGGGERTEENQMPVEETANMVILTAALAQMEGNANFAAKYWPTLVKWADYLKDKGFDPERQLCTDDFAGHLAHNVNLSGKAIVALGAYSRLCELRGQTGTAKEYRDLAKQFVARWIKEADDGDHFRLAFDQPGTWSQKYNLIWDKVLKLDLFPADALRKEMAYYPKVIHQYGLALDNRKAYAELPWTFWTASLTGNPADFAALLAPIYDYAQSTPSRVPFADFYWTQTAKEAGMHARPVIGGIFIRTLLDPALWAKWAGRDKTRAANWAPLPTPPTLVTVLPAADQQPAMWRYTTAQPATDWFQPAFDCSAWPEGRSGFGTRGTPGAINGTTWNTGDIWLRREVQLPERKLRNLHAWLHHDEDVEVYLNGVLAFKASGWVNGYDTFPLTSAGKAALKPGKNVIAVHCHQTTGGQYIDLGLVDLEAN